MRRTDVWPILLVLGSFMLIPLVGSAQEDLLRMLEEQEEAVQEKVTAVFKTTRVIQAHSIETVKAKTLDVRITHRFGNIYSTRNDVDGVHSFFGFDNIADVRLAVEYGITNELMVGIGRSQNHELVDGFVKYRFYQQTTDNKRPISLAAFTNITVDPQRESVFYSGVRPDMVAAYSSTKRFFHRLSYTAQLIIARKFSPSISFELLPTYVHRNFVRDPQDENGVFALGVAGRIKVSKRVVILADYFYVFSPYRWGSSTEFYMPISIGVEIETGGHVFHIDLTNARGIETNNFLIDSPDSWEYAEFKLGFNISRVFNLTRKRARRTEKD